MSNFKQLSNSILFAGTTGIVILAQSCWANNIIQVTDIQYNSTEKGLETILKNTGEDSAKEINNYQLGKKVFVEIPNTELNLQDGNFFERRNPTPKINFFQVEQIMNKILVTGASGFIGSHLCHPSLIVLLM